MPVRTERLSIETSGKGQIFDITSDLHSLLSSTSFVEGIMTVFVPGSTGGVTTVEYEPGLVHDLDELWERLAPSHGSYHHDAAWHDGNGHSHVRASLLGPSLTVPFADGALLLGTWQQVIFIDFDVRPRSRTLIVQCMGEAANA